LGFGCSTQGAQTKILINTHCLLEYQHLLLKLLCASQFLEHKFLHLELGARTVTRRSSQQMVLIPEPFAFICSANKLPHAQRDTATCVGWRIPIEGAESQSYQNQIETK